MSVGELGPADVVTIDPDSDLGDVAETLEGENVGAIVVVDDEAAPVGIVTDRDVALQVHQTDDVASMSVEEVMTEELATIRADAEPMEISRQIDEHNVRRFPIVDEDGSLTGIVTLDDLVATIGEQLENVTDTIEAQSPAYSP